MLSIVQNLKLLFFFIFYFFLKAFNKHGGHLIVWKVMNNTFFHVGLVKFLLFNIADSIV